MADLSPLALEFVRNLSKAIRAFRIYAPDHRETQKGIEEAAGSLRKLVQAEPAVTLGSHEGALIVENVSLRDASPAVKGFCDLLAARNIASIRVEQGFTTGELTHLLNLLTRNPEEILREHKLRPELLEPLGSIRLNEVKFIAVLDGAAEGGAGAGSFLPPAKLTELLTSLIGAQTSGSGDSSDDLLPDLPAGPMNFRALGTALSPLLSAAGKGQALDLTTRLFDQIVDRNLADRPAGEFVEEYLRGVGSLPEEMRKALGAGGAGPSDAERLIERLPLGLRGRVVAEDLLRGATPEGKLRASVSRLAPTAGEFVRLFETVSRMSAEKGGTPQETERRNESLLRLLPLSEELKRKRRSVLLLARDAEDRRTLTRSLEEGGVRVANSVRAGASLAALAGTGAYDALIVDISRYHLAELQALTKPPDPATSAGKTGVSTPPLVLLEDTLLVRDPGEAASCPEGTFLYKPVETSELMEALNSATPRGTAEEGPPPSSEEVEEARELKPYLQPKELPGIAGYTLAVFHREGVATGGNCHEVVPLAGRRFGIVLLDVTGFGAAAPAALFAARSLLLRAAQTSDSAGRALARVNEALGRTLPRGTFVNAAYAILDPASGQLSVACAGLGRPIRWTDGVQAVKVIQSSGLPLGPAPGPEFERTLRPVTVSLSPGDHVLLYTDGATEAINPAWNAFGERRVAQAVGRAPQGPAGPAVVEVVEAILAHAGAKPLGEDLTLLEIHRESDAPSEAPLVRPE